MLAEPPFSLLQTLSDVDDALDCNAEIAEGILKSGLQAFGLPHAPESGHPQNWRECARAGDVDKAHSTIRQFFRDWSAEGIQERKPCYDFVLEQLRSMVGSSPTAIDNASRPWVLVPGAGLGRLVYEVSLHGYNVEGNEISYHQLLASNWVLNQVGATAYALYPFATQFNNLRSRKQQLRKFMIPDVCPTDGLGRASVNGDNHGEMRMAAADFVILYSSEKYRATFDAVASVFFIDTAPNLIRYIDTVSNSLKTNGIWINVGPLLWHSDATHDTRADDENVHEAEAGARDGKRDAGIGEPGSFELTEEEVIWLLEKKGFRIEQREISSCEIGYIRDADSMLQNRYRVSRWVARKIE
jgi:carnosine N-methyltransferase